MKLRPLRTLRAKTPWLVLLGLLAFGCSRLPTAPELSARDLDRAPAGSTLVSQQLEPLEPLLPGIGADDEPVLPTLEPDTLVRDENIDGSVGGGVSVGYVQVVVPSGAYTGMAQIRITIPNEDSLMCHLEIFPASKNQFAEPVIVTFDIDGGIEQVGPLQTLGVFWFDEEHRRWVQIPAEIAPDRRTISAELSHFSQYKVAKASWNKASW